MASRYVGASPHPCDWRVSMDWPKGGAERIVSGILWAISPVGDCDRERDREGEAERIVIGTAVWVISIDSSSRSS
jgi:hypothetical protein